MEYLTRPHLVALSTFLSDDTVASLSILFEVSPRCPSPEQSYLSNRLGLLSSGHCAVRSHTMLHSILTEAQPRWRLSGTVYKCHCQDVLCVRWLQRKKMRTTRQRKCTLTTCITWCSTVRTTRTVGAHNRWHILARYLTVNTAAIWKRLCVITVRQRLELLILSETAKHLLTVSIEWNSVPCSHFKHLLTVSIEWNSVPCSHFKHLLTVSIEWNSVPCSHFKHLLTVSIEWNTVPCSHSKHLLTVSIEWNSVPCSHFKHLLTVSIEWNSVPCSHFKHLLTVSIEWNSVPCSHFKHLLTVSIEWNSVPCSHFKHLLTVSIEWNSVPCNWIKQCAL